MCIDLIGKKSIERRSEGVKDQEELRVSVQEKGKRDSLVKTIISKSKKQDGKYQEQGKKNG